MDRRNRIAAFVAVALMLACPAFRAQEGGGHSLYGDLRVDESKVSGPKPLAYTITLSQPGAVRENRQTVPNNGRYRFQDVENGEYNLVVTVEGVEVARLNFIIQELRKTDIRKDIQMQWDPAVPAAAGARTAQALEVYDRPAATAADFKSAEAAMGRKDYKQAASILEQVTQKDPKDFQAWTDLGTARFNQDKLGDAEKAYVKALEGRPAFLLAQLNLGKVRIGQKNFEGAIEVLVKAAQDHPQSADVQYFLGESYLQIKKGSKAVGHLNEALRLDPVGKADAHLRLGTLYNAAGLKDRAVAEYERYLSKKPDSPEKDKLKQYIQNNRGLTTINH